MNDLVAFVSSSWTDKINPSNTTIIITSKKDIKMLTVVKEKEESKKHQLKIERSRKIMQIRQSTYERLRNHSIYYHENSANSYDDMIVKLLDFYEERYVNENYNNNNDYDSDSISFT